jgi:hypothetical protein
MHEIMSHDSVLLIEPGHTCTMIAERLRGAVLPSSVAFDTRSEATFAIADLRIGNRSVLRSGGAWVPLHGGRIEMDRIELAQWFRFQAIAIGQDFRIDVVNTGHAASPFIAWWTCETIDPATLTAKCAEHGHVQTHDYSESCIRCGVSLAALGLTGEPLDPDRAGIFSYVSAAEAVAHTRDIAGRIGASNASQLGAVPGRSGRPQLEVKTPPGWGWDPGDPDGED